MGKTPSTAGKGDRPRAVNGKRFRANWDAIFAPKCSFPDCGCPADPGMCMMTGGAMPLMNGLVKASIERKRRTK